jgi:hypothetical protein
MLQSILLFVRGCPAAIRRSLPRLWREPVPSLPPTASGLQIPLHPSRVLRHGRRLMLALQCAYLAQLLVLGHLRVAGLVAVACVAFAWSCRAANAARPRARRLLLSADGKLHLLDAGGQVVPVVMQPCSMRLGPWLLLVLGDAAGVLRLLLGPDNLDAQQLAALQRVVAAIPQRPGGTR